MTFFLFLIFVKHLEIIKLIAHLFEFNYKYARKTPSEGLIAGGLHLISL